MFKEIKLRDIIGEGVHGKIIQDEGRMNFLVTFKTHAYEQGHVNWLSRNLEVWAKETKQASGISVINMTIRKAPKKGSEGSIEVGMEISGTILMLPFRNSRFHANLVSTIRKTLAETILCDYAPKFDVKNPLFDALHVYNYTFTVAYSCRETEGHKEKIERLIENSINLAIVIEKCGALFHGIQYDADNELISMALKWRQHATEEKREVLENTFRAFFLGMGIDCFNLKIQPQ